jgi:glycosyltransferase involved in cell wall biosynthesis
LPPVATHVPGCREVVRADENGILVPAGDAKALANGLEHRVLAATLAIYRSKSEE